MTTHTITGAFDPPRLPPRRRERRWLHPVLIFFVMAVLVDAVFGEQGVATGRRARRELEAAGAQLLSVQDENTRLREEIRRLREDPETIEYVARKDLQMMRPGEILVVVR
jgi:cell division protein FtsB